ncbi:methyl-accepting chemotaxis protein [Paenibacillus sp. PK4536]|uniref:Putative methyl-accepting chemotaxis protein n=1 Tax=Paenibacillus nuruki TaxID=1886670 RepID=A0A1E3L810_9BACL|nr:MULTISPECIES: HAMP domain-containing methyl-accepting chemotaxis protein [Paenibacillus]ODP29731.1 putative methyl-accepting chemotaxis protein [Paenibacillus nuruki]TKJ91463.1 methyl-accepting chemotaxis protein [Paenibacillus sp. CFBP13512]WIM37691.1 methyl-accepting chemotaxis protein [Paenibacillus sp. PK4536]CAJ1315666.1 Methyl-accepting chemotaxis protein [Paenibacillus nuruki]
MKKISRLSFFAKNLLISAASIILIGVILLVSSYFTQKTILINQLHGQVQAVTDTFAQGITLADVEKLVAEKSYEGAKQTEIRSYLDNINKYNPNISQAYIFGTELADGNKTSLIAVPTKVMEALKQGNIDIGYLYEQPTEIVNGIQEMLKTKQPTFTSFYTDDLGLWTTILYPIQNGDGKVVAYFGVDADASAVPEGLNQLLVRGITIMVLFLIVIFLLQFFVVRRTLAPLRELIRGIEDVSKGNLDIHIKTGKDDLGIINHKFNQMVEKMNSVIVNVQSASQQVTESAKMLMDTSSDNSERSLTLISNIQDIANGMKYQEEATEDTAKAMGEISTVIHTIANNSSNVADQAYSMEQKSVEGNKVVNQVTEQMTLISRSVHDTSKAVELLESRSQEIGNILGIITGISGQTNLLALNASIEAARVGEHGRGFAVVAGEVRNLAEQSAQSANQISTLITEIQTEIQNAVTAMKKGTEEVEYGLSIADQTGKLFAEIQSVTKQVTEQIQDISSATQEISAGTEEMTATTENLKTTASVAAENSAKVSQHVEGQKSSIISTTDAANQLSTMAEQLQELISHFHVRKID